MKIHPQFKFNGQAFSKSHLSEIAYSLIKEGAPFEQPLGDFLLDWFDKKETVTVMTSGSTGRPKPIRLRKQYMANSAKATAAFFGLEAGDSALLCLPTDYIAGKMMLVRALVFGLELDVVEPSSNPLGLVEKTYDFCAMVPLQAEKSLRELKKVKKLIIGGAPVPSRLRNALCDMTTQCYETYGMTETITHIAAKQLNGFSRESDFDNAFQVLDDVEINTDDRGCLVISAPKVAEETIYTNDLVKVLDNQRFQWMGRYDNIINSGGVKLHPEQIEAKLAKVVPGRFFVAGLPDKTLGQKLVLVVEGKGGGEALRQKLEQFGQITKFEVPKDIYFLDAFVQTASSKIHRAKTLEQLNL